MKEDATEYNTTNNTPLNVTWWEWSWLLMEHYWWWWRRFDDFARTRSDRWSGRKIRSSVVFFVCFSLFHPSQYFPQFCHVSPHSLPLLTASSFSIFLIISITWFLVVRIQPSTSHLSNGNLSDKSPVLVPEAVYSSMPPTHNPLLSWYCS